MQWCAGGDANKKDVKRLIRLTREAGQVLEWSLKPAESVVKWRVLGKVKNIQDSLLSSSVSNRLE